MESGVSLSLDKDTQDIQNYQQTNEEKDYRKTTETNEVTISSEVSSSSQAINRWNEQNMEGAINEYHEKDGKVSVWFLARVWKVPRTTLKLRLDNKTEGSRHKRKRVLSDEAQAQLVVVIKELAQVSISHEGNTSHCLQLHETKWPLWLLGEKAEGWL